MAEDKADLQDLKERFLQGQHFSLPPHISSSCHYLRLCSLPLSVCKCEKPNRGEIGKF